MKFISKMYMKLFVIVCLASILIFAIPRIVTYFYSKNKTYSPSDAPTHRIAIVFGAGLKHDGTPTAILQERVEAASELYLAGKIEKILMSGDNRFTNYNEPGAMTDYAISLGVPPENIVQDFAGRRTYDTCYRAKNIFLINEAILVTQGFHLPRALFLCNMFKINSVGVIPDRHRYQMRSQLIWGFRETFATLTAFFDIWLRHPLPVLGNPEPIFPEIHI